MPVTPKPKDVGSEKLPRKAILRHRRDFEEIRAKGKRVTGAFLILNWLLCSPRLVGIIIPKAVGNAVQRNKVRRRVREIYRKLQKELPQEIRSVWVVRKKAAEADYKELQNEMMKLYRKAKVL